MDKLKKSSCLRIISNKKVKKELFNFYISNPGTNVTILCENNNVNRYYFYQTIRKLPNYQEYLEMKERRAEERNKARTLREEKHP
jgi:hypothetical protein